MRWDYGGAYRELDMNGVIALPNDSKVQVCDWMAEPLPAFMHEADVLFVDPPWNLGNMRSFYTKADQPHPPFDFWALMDRLFEHVAAINPRTTFLEMGVKQAPTCIENLTALFPYVTPFASTYYHRQTNRCQIIVATRDASETAPPIAGMDEEDVVKWLCREHAYRCIGDLCMGRGLVGREAFKNGRKFVGTELNPKRLAVLVDFIRKSE